MPSAILTTELAKEAARRTRPMIKSLIEEGRIPEHGVHIVIALRVPGVFFADCNDWVLDKGILHEETVGRVQKGNRKFVNIARSKAFISAREGLSTFVIQTQARELLRTGDTTYYGSALDGNIVVAASGADPYDDEAISKAVAGWCIALVKGVSDREELQTNDEGFLL